MQSVRAFSGANDANEMLKGLRYFERKCIGNTTQGKPGMESKGYFNILIDVFSHLVILDMYNIYENYNEG